MENLNYLMAILGCLLNGKGFEIPMTSGYELPHCIQNNPNNSPVQWQLSLPKNTYFCSLYKIKVLCFVHTPVEN